MTTTADAVSPDPSSSPDSAANAVPNPDCDSIQWPILICICIGVFVSSLDATMVNIAFPTLSRVFQAPISTISWLSLVHLITSASLLTVFGSLADTLGYRRVFLAGFLVHMFGSLAVGASQSVLQMILLRIVQGAGSSIMMATSIALINNAVPANRRATGIGVFEAAVGVALTIGPLIGGVLIDYVHWRAIFYVSVPIGLAGYLLGLRVIPKQPPPLRGRRFDIAGAATFAIGLSCLLLGITQSKVWGWGSTPVLTLFAIAGVFLPAFVIVERRAYNPMIAISLLANRAFTTANLAKLFAYMGLFTAVFLMPFYFQEILNYSPSVVGLALLPFPLMHMLGSGISGPFADRFGAARIAPIGMLIAALGVAGLLLTTSGSNYAGIAIAMSLVALGMAIFITPNDAVIMDASPADKMGIAGAILALTRNFGMIWGVTIAATILSFRLPRYTAFFGPDASNALPYMATFRDIYKASILIFLISMVLAVVRVKPRATDAAHPPRPSRPLHGARHG